MKILYLITKSNWGGAQRYVYELATAFSKNHDVVVALGGTGGRDALPGLLAEKLKTAGVRIVFVPSFERDIAWFKEFRVIFDLISLLKKEKPDIVHLNSSKAGGVGALAARITRVPKIIFTVHGWPFNEDRRPWYWKQIAYWGSWFTLLFSHKVITITTQDYNEFQSKKVTLIHNGI